MIVKSILLEMYGRDAKSNSRTLNGFREVEGFILLRDWKRLY